MVQSRRSILWSIFVSTPTDWAIFWLAISVARFLRISLSLTFATHLDVRGLDPNGHSRLVIVDCTKLLHSNLRARFWSRTLMHEFILFRHVLCQPEIPLRQSSTGDMINGRCIERHLLKSSSDSNLVIFVCCFLSAQTICFQSPTFFSCTRFSASALLCFFGRRFGIEQDFTPIGNRHATSLFRRVTTSDGPSMEGIRNENRSWTTTSSNEVSEERHQRPVIGGWPKKVLGGTGFPFLVTGFTRVHDNEGSMRAGLSRVRGCRESVLFCDLGPSLQCCLGDNDVLSAPVFLHDCIVAWAESSAPGLHGGLGRGRSFPSNWSEWTRAAARSMDG